jgi:hypothetical protein
LSDPLREDLEPLLLASFPEDELLEDVVAEDDAEDAEDDADALGDGEADDGVPFFRRLFPLEEELELEGPRRGDVRESESGS